MAIMGMRDNSCREHLIEILERLNGVKAVDVSLIRATVTIMHQSLCTVEDLMIAIRRAGLAAEVISSI